MNRFGQVLENLLDLQQHQLQGKLFEEEATYTLML